jgi:hypothetical protein
VRLNEAGGSFVEGPQRRGVVGLCCLTEPVEGGHGEITASAGGVAGAEGRALVLWEDRSRGV